MSYVPSSVPVRPAWFGHAVRSGLLLLCHFPQGIEGQEIGDKCRPAIVVSPAKANMHSATVVPLSRRPPENDIAIELPYGRYRILSRPGCSSWAKVQCISHVGFDRLELFSRHGRFLTPHLDEEDLGRVQLAIFRYLLPELTDAASSHPEVSA